MISTLQGPFEIAHNVDRVAPPSELPSHFLRKAALHGQYFRAVMRVVGILARHHRRPAGHFGRLLRVEVEIDHGRGDLEVDLHLVVGTRRPEEAPQFAIFQDKRRVHRVAHPPARSKTIRVPRFEVPIGHAIVEKYAGTASDNTRPPEAVDALDARNAVAALVGGAEVRRLASGSGARRGRLGLVRTACFMSIFAANRAQYSAESNSPNGASTVRGSLPQRSRSAKASFLASTITCTRSADPSPISAMSKFSRIFSSSRRTNPVELGGASRIVIRGNRSLMALVPRRRTPPDRLP